MVLAHLSVAPMSFALYFGGGETPSWRKRLIEHDVGRIALNFTDLRSRLPKTREWVLDDHFPDETKLGLYWSPKDWSRTEEIEFAHAYRDFAEEHYDRLSWVTTFRQAGPDWAVPLWDEKMLPEALLKGADEGLVAVTGKQLESRRARSFRASIRSLGGSILGVGVSDPEQMAGLLAATSSSWISATRYGEFVIWDGSRLRRFNAKGKVAQRPRYRNAIKASGVDLDAVMADEKEAVIDLTLWSWQQMENDMVTRRVRPLRYEDDEVEADDPQTVNLITRFAPSYLEPNVDVTPDLVGGLAQRPGHSREIQQREQVPLPILSIGSKTVVDADGAETATEVASLGKGTLRNCDSCVISDRCPGYKPHHGCAYSIPIEVRNKDQLTSLLTGMIEMQSQRVLFTRMNEELDGGYPDPTLSLEMDRLFTMTEKFKVISDNRDFINVQIEAKGEAGILSRIFGDHVGQQARALPSGGIDPTETDAFVADQLGIVDAVVVDDLITGSGAAEDGTAHTHEGASDVREPDPRP